MTKENMRVCVCDEQLAGALDEFCRIVWPKSSSDGVPPSQKTVGNEGAERRQANKAAPVFLFLKDEHAIGHIATIPVRLSTAAGVFPLHWIVGFMVLPKYRNSLVGPLLIKEVNRVLPRAMSLHVEAPVLRILTGLKWKHIGVLPQYVRVMRAQAIMRNVQPSVFGNGKGAAAMVMRTLLTNRLIRGMAGAGLAIAQGVWLAAGAARRPGGIKAVVQEEQGFDGTYTDLWRSVRGKFPAAMVRDEPALRARYERKKDRYRFLGCRQGNALLGYFVLKIKACEADARLGDIKIGTIVDCLYDPDLPAIGQTLLTHAVQCFTKEGVDVVLCTASLQKIRRLLVMNGFCRIPGNLNCAYHVKAGLPMDDIVLDDWHLMRGDSDADQNF